MPGIRPHPLFDCTGRLARPPLRLLLREARAYVGRRGRAPAPASVPAGDGHPVLVIPAFLKGDSYTGRLRRFLTKAGYAVHAARSGVNIGPTKRALARLERRLAALHARYGRPVSLVGHSLGGTFARELAKLHPEQVRQVICLGSPIRLPTASNVEVIYRLLGFLHRRPSPDEAERLTQPPPVPAAAIYSRRDGIVAWESCLEMPGPGRVNIEVDAAHVTMPSNPAVILAVGRLLARSVEEMTAAG